MLLLLLIINGNCSIKIFLNYFKYIFYGIVQGLTEFFPISSSAHLKIISEFFNLNDPGVSLSAIIQLGSVIAILIYFKEDIKIILKNDTHNFHIFQNKIFISIFLGTLCILIFGAVVKFIIPDFYNNFLRSNLSIGLISIFTGFLMYLTEFRKNKDISLKKLNFINSFLIGVAQAFAVIPGVSRSGITITAALFLGWNRLDAAKFSFLLGIPAISIAALVEIYTNISSDFLSNYGPLLLALISSFLSSFFSIKFLIRYISFKGLRFFVYYKIIFGTFILINEFGLFKII